APPPGVASESSYRHSIAVRPPVLHSMAADRLNIITERLVNQPPFDLVIATNVLAYFDDQQLALALANIGAMLRDGGYLLHNESRHTLIYTPDSLDPPLTHIPHS